MCVLYTQTHTEGKGDLYCFSTVLLTQAQPAAATSQSQFLSISLPLFSLANDLAAGKNYQTKGVMIGLL